PIAEFGSDAQKETWLRRLASGRALGAFALSEEHAGSDAANQQTAAHPDDRGYVLNGRKVWVANAEAADVAIVFAATEPGSRAALEAAVGHAKSHEAFGQPIGAYQAIQWMLADSATELEAARMLMFRAADARQRGGRPTLEAAMAKLAASQAAHRSADRAMQI